MMMIKRCYELEIQGPIGQTWPDHEARTYRISCVLLYAMVRIITAARLRRPLHRSFLLP